jgi:integrase
MESSLGLSVGSSNRATLSSPPCFRSRFVTAWITLLSAVTRAPARGCKHRSDDRMLNSAWRKARVRAGLPTLRVHDLKHTFGRRLRSAGVNFEDRQDLLGHKSGRMTTHYSAAEIGDLIDAANRVVRSRKTPALTILNFARERVST